MPRSLVMTQLFFSSSESVASLIKHPVCRTLQILKADLSYDLPCFLLRHLRTFLVLAGADFDQDPLNEVSPLDPKGAKTECLTDELAIARRAESA